MKIDPAYSSHLEPLIKIVGLTSGPVLEIGIGFGSTPVLHELCRDRKLISYENDASLVDDFKAFNTSWHEVHYVEDWDDMPVAEHWDVAFIDHKPARRRRTEIKRLKPFADFIIMHDTEEEADKYFRMLNRIHGFQYIWHSDYIPRTTIVSDRYFIPL
jgi:hypothetical protein